MDESRISGRVPAGVDLPALCQRLLAREATIAVIGLGYVGLPLAVALARHFRVTGFDIDPARIDELRLSHDRTAEVDAATLKATSAHLTAAEATLADAELFIITVPTPVDTNNKPDLRAVCDACAAVGRRMKPGAIIVLESTVYPGVVETICGPELERASGLVCGRDFFLGYSPERANPGDREHTVERIVKVVAGQTPAVTEVIAAIYGMVTRGGVFRAQSIKVAEAAKAIENAQRDINIAFVNEVAMICSRIGISVYDVLDAATTKWNFLGFKPGLVGGHCIGVDPFYLAQCATSLGLHPEVILAGRRINDTMADFIAAAIAERLKLASHDKPRILILGLTFKENVPDLRNSKVTDLVSGLQRRGAAVDVHDPLADADEARALYGIELSPNLEIVTNYDCLVGAVPHRPYTCFEPEVFARLVKPGGIVADIKGMWRKKQLPAGITHWQL
jgi:UDP-N-acetyl-D-glucosamine/UDP-N-acetyl-D-galactosamine dehydrogenase